MIFSRYAVVFLPCKKCAKDTSLLWESVTLLFHFNAFPCEDVQKLSLFTITTVHNLVTDYVHTYFLLKGTKYQCAYGAAMALCIRVDLPSYSPGFGCQEQHQRLFEIIKLKLRLCLWKELNLTKRGQDWHIQKVSINSWSLVWRIGQWLCL